MVRRVLGAGVHSRAIGRLVELWPEAVVAVIHSPAAMQPRFTVVKVWESAEAKERGDAAVGTESTCAIGEQFHRRVGIAIAFKRALLKVKEVTEGGRV
jgi:hypothetical protein